MSRTRRNSTKSKTNSNKSKIYFLRTRSLIQYENRDRDFTNRFAGPDSPWTQTEEEIKAEIKRDFDRQFYDGRNGMTCTPINSGFKEKAKKAVRNANRRYCRAILSDESIWDKSSAPIEKEGSRYIWDFY